MAKTPWICHYCMQPIKGEGIYKQGFHFHEKCFKKKTGERKISYEW